MLGNGTEPNLLVNVDSGYDPEKFNFLVVNGAWHGVYTAGYITVSNPPGGAFSSLDQIEIICDDQDRLRGHYDTVFERYSDLDYVAPVPKPVVFDDMDDDIPF